MLHRASIRKGALAGGCLFTNSEERSDDIAAALFLYIADIYDIARVSITTIRKHLYTNMVINAIEKASSHLEFGDTF